MEIERGKGQMRGSVVLGLEDSGARMSRIGKSELCYGDVLGLDQLLGEIDAVTPADVAEVAAEVLAPSAVPHRGRTVRRARIRRRGLRGTR